MSYEMFQTKVWRLVFKAGGGFTVRFINDTDAGRFIARFSDGTIIVAVPSSTKVTVRYGAGHTAMATI